jgi:hypothetical protein
MSITARGAFNLAHVRARLRANSSVSQIDQKEDLEGAAPADGTFRCPSPPVTASASLGREQTGNRSESGKPVLRP